MFPRNTDEQVCLFEEFNLKASIDYSGTLQAGHYWAYIKDEDNHGWLKYNFDTHCYNPSQKKSLSVLYLCVIISLCSMSLSALWSRFVLVYIIFTCIYTFFILHMMHN